jgi:hypothetical protein
MLLQRLAPQIVRPAVPDSTLAAWSTADTVRIAKVENTSANLYTFGAQNATVGQKSGFAVAVQAPKNFEQELVLHGQVNVSVPEGAATIHPFVWQREGAALPVGYRTLAYDSAQAFIIPQGAGGSYEFNIPVNPQVVTETNFRHWVVGFLAVANKDAFVMSSYISAELYLSQRDFYDPVK